MLGEELETEHQGGNGGYESCLNEKVVTPGVCGLTEKTNKIYTMEPSLSETMSPVSAVTYVCH